MEQINKYNRKLILVCLVLTLAILLTNSVYALIVYTIPDQTNIEVGVGDLGIIYNKGVDITGDIPVATDKTGAASFDIELWKTIKYDVYGRLYLSITDISDVLRNSDVIKWEVWSNEKKLSSGSLKCADAGTELTLYQNFLLQNTKQIFTVYMWADFELSDSSLNSTSLSGSIKAQASQIVFTEIPPSTDCEIITPPVEDTTPTITSTIETTSAVVGDTLDLMDGISVTDPSGTTLTSTVSVNGNVIPTTSGTTVNLGLTNPSNVVTYTVTNEKGESASVSRTYNISTKNITQYSTASQKTTQTPSCGSCRCGSNGEVECVGCAVCPWDGVSYSNQTSCGTYSGWSTSRGSGECCRKRACTINLDGSTSCASYTSC